LRLLSTFPLAASYHHKRRLGVARGAREVRFAAAGSPAKRKIRELLRRSGLPRTSSATPSLPTLAPAMTPGGFRVANEIWAVGISLAIFTVAMLMYSAEADLTRQEGL
jgi:hypothetical protein